MPYKSEITEVRLMDIADVIGAPIKPSRIDSGPQTRTQSNMTYTSRID
jgi:hypothetical protein